MRISNLKKTVKESDLEISVLIESKNIGYERLWFSIPQDFKNSLSSHRMDGFLVGMLYPAMFYGEDIHVQGCVSEKLLININKYVIPLIKSFSPNCNPIKVTADEISNTQFDCNGIGTGFSAGVDSFSTIYDRYELENSLDYKINTFLFLNVGSHGWGKSAEMQAVARHKFNTRFAYLKQYPDSLGIDFIPVDSNLHTFHPWGHQRTHTLTSVAGVLILQARFRRYYYASSGVDYKEMLRNAYKYQDIDIGEYCDPILLPLLSTESLEFVSDGIQYTRVEKTLRISNYGAAREYLNVCIGDESTHVNCSICGKCCRTLMTLTSAGIVSEFSHLFDIRKYQKQAARQYIAKQVLQKNNDPFAKDNLELARFNGVKLPNHLTSLLIVNWHSLNYNYLRFIIPACKKIIPKKIKEFIKSIFYML